MAAAALSFIVMALIATGVRQSDHKGEGTYWKAIEAAPSVRFEMR
jgi:hypothetical protein